MEISTRDQAIKALHDLTTEQKRLAARGDALEQRLEAKTADLKAIQQKLAEQSAPAVVTVSEQEATLRRHINADGSIDVAGLCNDSVNRGEWHAEFKRLVDDRNLCRMLTKNGKGSKGLDAKLMDHMEKSPRIIQRLFSDASAVGEDFVPDLYLPELARKLYAPTALEAAFPTLTMTSKELKIPFSSAAVAPYLKSGASWTSIGASDSATSQISVTAQSFAARITADEDTAADSIVAAMDYFRQELQTALSSGVEDAILNGDTTAAHADLATPGSPRLWDASGRWNTGSVISDASDHRRSFIGLRAAAFDKGTGRNAAAMTYVDIMATRSLLGSGYQASGDLLMVVSPSVMVKHLLALDEVSTLDNFGPAASILTGSIAKLAGMDVLISGFMTEDLDAAGVYTGGVSDTQTGYVICHRPSWRVANYKPTTVDMDREISKGQVEIVATRRTALVDMSDTNKSVAYGYNVDSV